MICKSIVFDFEIEINFVINCIVALCSGKVDINVPAAISNVSNDVSVVNKLVEADGSSIFSTNKSGV